MKTAFLTTIFPASETFLETFFDSLKKQTVTNFDIIVINDGVTSFEKIKKKYSALNIIEFKVNFSPAKNREFGIKKVVEAGYDYIIFGDSDDYFENNRVKISLELLENSAIVINELTIFNKNEFKYHYLSNFLSKQKNDIKFFFNKNIAGLSNMAIKTSLVKNKKINFNNDLIAVDWYFITILLLQNPEVKIHFTNKTSTYYRQYEHNTIGISDIISKERIKLGLKVKLIHYKNLGVFCEQNQITSFIETFRKKHQEIVTLADKIEDNAFLEKYLSIIKSNFNKIFRGWWSEIITLNEFKNYENNKK